MSEYQYYEFQAIDRRLSAGEMSKLRGFSTRARITPTSFVNEYDYGSFKGDEDAWMEKYFDAFLYYANWGTRVLKLRVSSRLLDLATAELYCFSDSASAYQSEGNTILSFHSEEEESEWPEESDALSALIPIRTQLAGGDLRSLYIGWLLSAQTELEDDDLEPPVPPGLGELDGSLERLVDFLRVDTDLLEVAAASSAPLTVRQPLTRDAIRTWIGSLPQAEKDDYLERFVAGEDLALAAELQRRIDDPSPAVSAPPAARTVGALVHQAEVLRNERKRAKAARVAAERKRREEEAALARAKYLEDLARREPAVWAEINELIAMTQPAGYDRAVGLLVDLRDIAVVNGSESIFAGRVQDLRMAHARKPSLLARMERAGLR